MKRKKALQRHGILVWICLFAIQAVAFGVDSAHPNEVGKTTPDIVAMGGWPYKRITNDEIKDSNPRIDNGQIVWLRETDIPGERAIMFYDSSGMRQLATVPSANAYVEIENGWVFWEAVDLDDYDYEKWVYNVATDQVTQISDDVAYDNYRHRFENGMVLWEVGADYGARDLVFFDGVQTTTLAHSGEYRSFSFSGGCVVWEGGDGGPNLRDYDIMLYDGSNTMYLNEMGVANGFSRHVLIDSQTQGGSFLGPYWNKGSRVAGHRVVWMAWDEQDNDWEILFYDGGSVRQITNNQEWDYNPQVWGDHVAWVQGWYELWFYSDEENVLLTDDFHRTEHSFVLRDNKVVWDRGFDGPLWVFHTDTKTSVMLQDSAAADGYKGLWGAVFDDKGVCWYISKDNFGTWETDYYLRVYDGIEIKDLDILQDAIVGPYYQGGYVAWSNMKQNNIECRQWVSQPPPGHYEEIESSVRDREVFLYDPSGETLQLTVDDLRNCSGVTDIDNGLVVWCGEAPPPLPECRSCFAASCQDIFLGGRAVDDLSISEGDITFDQILEDGQQAAVHATVRNEGAYPVSDVKVALLIDSVELATETIASLAPGTLAQVSFQWDVSWTIKDKRRKSTIEVKVDPDDEIYEVAEANNRAWRSISGLLKGEKWDTVDGTGFKVLSPLSVPYVTPVAIWFDDDAARSEDGTPTRYYNPMATSQDVLDDIEDDFNGTQFPYEIDNLNLLHFTTSNAKDIAEEYWVSSSGMVLVDPTNQSELAGAPVASYLNWPMVSSDLLSPLEQAAFEDMIDNLDVHYLIGFADNEAGADNIVLKLKALGLPPERHLFVKIFTLEPFDNNEAAEAFAETLRAFGDRPSSIVITNSRNDSCLAAAPLAAFYKSLVLDVRDVVTGAVSYSADTYAGLQSINTFLSSITDKAGDHDVKGFIQKYMAPGSVTVYLVGTVKWLPFGIEQEPAGMSASDSDSDWIGSDYRYYHAHSSIVPGGRMPLSSSENVNYVAMALQFDELLVGNRDVGDSWEDNVMGAGTFNINGRRRWSMNHVWWMEPIIFQLDDFHKKAPGLTITRLFEDPWLHQGGWGANWYRFDKEWAQWFKMKGKRDEIIEKAPIIWDIQAPLQNPIGAGNRGDGINNDYDMIGYEGNDGRHPVEHIWDVNFNEQYDPEVDVIVHDGLTPGIQATTFVELIDEEVWDGFDNDGDFAIDEDCSYWHLVQLAEVYNEALDDTVPDLEPGDYIDLIDTNVIDHLPSQGFIMYAGHAWTTTWAMSNMGGKFDPGDPNGATPPNFDPPPKTTDDRTYDETHLNYNEVPDMAPSVVIVSACGSSRAWETNNIALSFLEHGSLSYIGATSIAYGSSDELRQQMFNRIVDGKLHIGKAFGFAVDHLDKNDLWALRCGEGNVYADKTRYEFNLFGLGSTEILLGQVEDSGITPGATTYDRASTTWSAGTPVYDSQAMTWSVDVTFDFPEPIEVEDGEGSVIEFILPHDLMTYFSDTGDYPVIRSLPFDYDLPVGGRVVDVSFMSSTVHRVYDFSLYKLTDKPKWPPDEEGTDESFPQSAEPELYQGPLYPDVLFVYGSEYDSLNNSDRIKGSVTAYQVDGTIPQTTVYDNIVLRITYTAPLGLEETHTVDEADLTVQATMVSTDGNEYTIIPKLTIETVGGLIHMEVVKEELTVGLAPQMVDFEVSDIELYQYVGRITLTENGALAAETSFEETAPHVELDPNLEAAIREALQKPYGPIFASELEGLTSLDASGRGIADLSGIENCPNLTQLNLNSNQIIDISVLSDLTSLTQLDLNKNQIDDIAPLVDNPGLGEGDSVDLRDNPLNTVSKETYLAQLTANGVNVRFAILLGDLNDDTRVDLADAILASQITSGAQPEQTVFMSCEVSGDGKIANEEVIYILQKACDQR